MNFFFFKFCFIFILFFFKFCFIFKLYSIVLVLPNIEMNLPQVYMCSPSWTLLPPPSPYHPSGSSQCTSPKHPVSCIEPGLATIKAIFIHESIEQMWNVESNAWIIQAETIILSTWLLRAMKITGSIHLRHRYIMSLHNFKQSIYESLIKIPLSIISQHGL